MANIIQLITILAALSELSLQATRADNEAALLIQRAQAEGRDVTNEELLQVQAARKSALDKWRKT
jgi:hypothetical protein